MGRQAAGELPGVRHLSILRTYDRVVVARHTHDLRDGASDTYASLITRVVEAAPNHARLSITDGGNGTMHYHSSADAMYVAVSAPEYPQRLAFKALSELHTRFEGSFGEALHKAADGGLSKAARPLMSEVCARFADAAAVDTTFRVRREVDETRGILGETIDTILATHENLEVCSRAAHMSPACMHASMQARMHMRRFHLWLLLYRLSPSVAAGARGPQRRPPHARPGLLALHARDEARHPLQVPPGVVRVLRRAAAARRRGHLAAPLHVL